MKEAYIIGGIRTPIGKMKGGLSAVRPDDMAALTLEALIKRHPQIDFRELGEVLLGCANQAGEDNRNVARMASLLAGIPISVPAETINRLCASGLSANVSAARLIQTGDAGLVIGGGVESMTRAPFVMGKAEQAFSGQMPVYDSSFGWRFINPRMKEKFGADPMGTTAENLADLYKINREDQDRFAYRSQEKAGIAQHNGRFSKEVFGVQTSSKNAPTQVFDKDEFIKPDTNMDGLAKLRPAFRTDGTVTAGNASGLNDGASAILWASEEKTKEFNLRPMARLVSWATIGVEPRIMGIGPVEASNLALKKAGLRMEQMDLIELNEAFAAQSLACIRKWKLEDLDPRINPNGGAIALGHPLGMSGSRILYSAALELSLTGQKYALVTMCVGLGQGYAAILERV